MRSHVDRRLSKRLLSIEDLLQVYLRWNNLQVYGRRKITVEVSCRWKTLKNLRLIEHHLQMKESLNVFCTLKTLKSLLSIKHFLQVF